MGNGTAVLFRAHGRYLVRNGRDIGEPVGFPYHIDCGQHVVAERTGTFIAGIGGGEVTVTHPVHADEVRIIQRGRYPVDGIGALQLHPGNVPPALSSHLEGYFHHGAHADLGSREGDGEHVFGDLVAEDVLPFQLGFHYLPVLPVVSGNSDAAHIGILGIDNLEVGQGFGSVLEHLYALVGPGMHVQVQDIVGTDGDFLDVNQVNGCSGRIQGIGRHAYLLFGDSSRLGIHFDRLGRCRHHQRQQAKYQVNSFHMHKYN